MIYLLNGQRSVTKISMKSKGCCNIELYFLDYEQEIYMRADASKIGCGAQLYQIIDGQERAIAFVSKTFTEAE